MNVCYYHRDQWTESGSLWQALSLDTGMRRRPYVIAFTGAGGKTSMIRRLAWEGRERGLKVLVATTTHMYRPSRYGVFSKDIGQVRKMLEQESVAVAGREAEDRKISFVGSRFYRQICPLADLVLVEADGSRRLPLKVPGTNEPVVPGNCNMVLSVYGLSVLGREAGPLCFRPELAMGIMDSCGRKGYMQENGWTVQPQDLACLMQHGYLYPLRAKYPHIPVIPVFNQADEPAQAQQARELLDSMGENRGLVCGQLRSDLSACLF